MIFPRVADVQDGEKVGPDGKSFNGRMEELCKKTAGDIKACTNSCGLYTRKKLLVKVLQGPIWANRLGDFVKKFTSRREEFQFALSIHSAVGIDDANKKMDEMHETLRKIEQSQER